MKPSLQLRTSQHLALTPQLQQSIRLLQLSTLELQNEVDQIIQQNPLLERLDDPLDNSLRLLADGALNPTSPNTASPEPTTTEPASIPSSDESDGAPETDQLPHSDAETISADWNYDESSKTNKSSDDEDSRPQIESPPETLREHLMEQVRLSSYDQRKLALLTLMVDAIDENGFLIESLDEILSWLPSELNVSLAELTESLAILQSLDPPGIGARSLSECLSLQIKLLANVPFVTRRTALAIVENHLGLFAQRDFTKLKKALDCDDEDLREAQVIIKRCNPRPGAVFANDAADAVQPDVIVKRAANGWSVELNQDVVPRLQLNAMYAGILKNNKGGARLSTQLQEAKWLIKNLRHRFDTILRVAQAIVERQKNFFSHGAVAMRPLVLREIADTLNLHESTISRVTTQKYMLTPHGMFELKYFFGSHIGTEAGGEASSTAIRELIKQLIGAEDQKSPFSDSKIAEILGEQGIVIARRTVAKYRESMKIPPVNLRKSL
ncbi:MAG: RNA polymerase factor sigma-54 [Oxalobacter sp.]|nr:MAG: RNA polymerase factor sigma-54 [Oxalobacter sp.]